jgi:hypothetical protein
MRKPAKDKTTAPADLTARSGHVPDVARPEVAQVDHLRRLGDGTYRLYVAGSQVPAAHRELEAIPVEQADGVYQVP